MTNKLSGDAAAISYDFIKVYLPASNVVFVRASEASTTLQAPDDPSVTAVTMRGLNRQVTREGLVSLLYHASLSGTW